MKNSSKKEFMNNNDDDLLPHYDFDYSKAQPNIYATYLTEQAGYVKLLPDVRKVFKSSEDVNNVLRAIIKVLPRHRKKSTKTV
ncbi:MAG: hypothetical protein A2X61_14740 [Ignavibacteria bacterium GWB2_35_12]|nr:MAG: hypothetical protein A2X63_06670 [Ignavibacteria bacterium GWA2_35_8]OGU38338.1 MAG: hypothetical protein A2X61_14740 [Ignavibacteria bacterium GWB2_35_12]OGU90695.1 MAG: hypothetical protein A2220_08690 [Ignavibacteria bacterium RIFOXYA2_FULL_35_10]OGV23426.1 MAG: hypothetical protein A2475_06515 [Ignavibacteria bacterium RIFOXYC2_FULL_35_21]